MEESKKEPFLGSLGSSDPSVQQDPQSGTDGLSGSQGRPNSLDALKKRLAEIESGDYIRQSRLEKRSNRRIRNLPSRAHEIFTGPVAAEVYSLFMDAYDLYKEIELETIPDTTGGIWKSFISGSFKEGPRSIRCGPVVEYQIALANQLISTYGCVAMPEFYHEGTISDCFAVIDGFAIDYEFKTNISDYLGDFAKTMRVCDIPVNKHVALAKGLLVISKHYFVVPERLLNVDQVPKHSGLITFNPEQLPTQFTVVKEAPVLNEPCDREALWEWVAVGLMKKLTQPLNALATFL